MGYQGADRRRAERVDASLRLEVRIPRTDGLEEPVEFETVNISTSGIYFRCDHFIEPMTKLAMDLEVLVPAETEGDQETALVPCEGLVVRCNPEAETAGCEAYEVAVFFTNVEPDGLIALECHIAMVIDNID